MMSMLMMFSVIITVIVAISSGNPVKMTMGLLVCSMAMVMQMSVTTNNSWFPSIFFLMFMSGILVMFMILSAILPNEKTMKMKKGLMFTIIISAWYLSFSLSKWEVSMKEVSSFLEEKSNMMLLMVMMTMYFLTFMKILSQENSSMKSSKLCLKDSNFVNFLMSSQ